MRDAHFVIVNDIGKIIGGKAVAFQENLILQLFVGNRNIPIDLIVIGRFAFQRHFLTDNVGFAFIQIFLNFFGRKIAAVTIIAKRGLALTTLTCFGKAFQALFRAKAAISFAFLNQLFGKGSIKIQALALHIWAAGASHIRTFIVAQATFRQRFIDELSRPFHVALAIRIFNAENKFPFMRLGDQPGIKRRAQIADMHKARGTWGKAGSSLDRTHSTSSCDFEL